MNESTSRQGAVSAKFQRVEQRVGKVPFWTKFAQGFSALPGQHKEWAFNTLLLLFYSSTGNVRNSSGRCNRNFVSF